MAKWMRAQDRKVYTLEAPGEGLWGFQGNDGGGGLLILSRSPSPTADVQLGQGVCDGLFDVVVSTDNDLNLLMQRGFRLLSIPTNEVRWGEVGLVVEFWGMTVWPRTRWWPTTTILPCRHNSTPWERHHPTTIWPS